MSDFDLTAIGSGYFIVSVNGVDVSKHTTEREAIQNAVNLEGKTPSDDVQYRHDYAVKVEMIPVLSGPADNTQVGEGGGVTPPANNAPVWNLPATISGTVGTNKTIDFIASGYVTDDDGPNAMIFSLASGTLPTGWAMDSARGVVFTGSQGVAGESATVTFNANDGINDAVSGDVLISTTASMTHDGPATPEQISLYILAAGYDAAATASCRFRPVGTTKWYNTHDLYRIKTWQNNGQPDAFAWPVTGGLADDGSVLALSPGTTYEVEVTVWLGRVVDQNGNVTTVGTAIDVKSMTHTTRSLPPAAGAVTKTIAAGSTRTQINTTLATLQAGDVLQFADGTYTLDGELTINLANGGGTEASPIYIRGTTKAGTIITRSTGRIFNLVKGNYIVFENMTLQGSNDPLQGLSSIGILLFNSNVIDGTTVRNTVMTGVDGAIIGFSGSTSISFNSCLVYHNDFTGNNSWNTTFIDTTTAGNNPYSWDDDCVRLPGSGNAIFENNMTGFGDSCAFAQNSTSFLSIGVHFYRNEIRNSCDDMAEVDYAKRNCTLYDNRCHNSMTFFSLDPLYGGPFVAFRNIAINVGRTPFKWNTPESGMFVYNNTVMQTQKVYITNQVNTGAEADWYQSSSGSPDYYGVRNNIVMYSGPSTQLIRFDHTTGNGHIDFDHNSWYHDGSVNWISRFYTSLANAFAGLPATVPVFSGITQRHTADNIIEASPFVDAVTLGANYRTEVTGTYTPTLIAGSVAKNSGVVIRGVTDGYSGSSPDRGAIISGRTVPVYGWTGDEQAPVVNGQLTLEYNADGTITERCWNLPLDQWIEVLDTAFSSHITDLLTPTGYFANSATSAPGPCTAVAPVFQAWCTAAMDKTTGRMWFSGGGHKDSGNNGIYQFDLKKMQWSITMQPTTITQAMIDAAVADWDAHAGWVSFSNCYPWPNDYWEDGKFGCQHTYRGMEWNPTTGEIFYAGFSHWYAINVTTGAVRQVVQHITGLTASFASDNACVLDDQTQKIFMFRAPELDSANVYYRVYDIDNDTLTAKLTCPSGCYTGPQAPIQIGRKIYLMTGLSPFKPWYVDIDTMQQTPLATPAAYPSVYKQAGDYSSVTGKIYLMRADVNHGGNSALWGSFGVYDPANDSWSDYTPSGAPPVPTSTQQHPYGKLRIYERGSSVYIILFHIAAQNLRIVRIR